MAVRPGILLAAALALAGCSADGLGLSRSEPAAARTAPTPQTAATTPRPAEPVRPRADMDALLNAVGPKVDGYLGTPQLVRREGAGEMRLYRSDTCVVHVFLFPRAGQLTAAHVEARAQNRRLSAEQADSCIASFS